MWRLFKTQSKEKRGSTILTVMIFASIITVMLASMTSYLQHLRDVTRMRRAGDHAFYAAESGIARAVSYIQEQSQGIYNSTFDVVLANPHYPFSSNAQIVDVNGTNMTAGSNDQESYVVRIYKENLGDAAVIVEATGRSTKAYQNVYRRINVQIRPKTFAGYAFFNTVSLSTMDGRRRWLAGGEEFWGPVHSNRYLFVGSGASSSNPLYFHSDVTMVKHDIYSRSENIQHTHFEGLKETNSDYIELPSDLTKLKNAAASGGIQLPEDDPYFDVNEDSDPNNDVAVPPNVFHGDPINNYELNFNGDQVTITNLFSGTSFTRSIDDASFNGALVVNEGNIFVQGNVDGKITMGALGTRVSTPTPYNQASNGNMIVTGNLTYDGHDASELTTMNPDFDNVNDVVGLIAERNFAIDGSVPTNCTVDAHVMVTGQATANPDVTTWSNTTSSAIPEAQGQDGAFFIEDGVQQDLSYIWSGGYHDSSGADSSFNEGQLYLNGGVVHFMRGQTKNRYGGYSRRYSFDQRLYSAPPPYYPITGDTYIAEWREQRKAGGDSFTF